MWIRNTAFYQCCGVESVIKLPPIAEAVITNYGSGSGSLLLHQRLDEIL